MSQTLIISPGGSGSTTLTITSPVSATPGSYPVGITVTNSANTAYTASISATYVIAAAPSVTVSTDKSSYTRNQTVTITAYVSSGGAPVANASVTFTVTEANGLVVAGKSTTGANGVASYKFRLKRQDPPGVYQVRADVTNAGLSGSATTSFEVR